MGDPAMKTWQLRAGLVAGAVALACSITISDLGAQGWATAVPAQPAWLDGLFYRPLTVFSRGGRVTAATGVPSDPQIFYMGAAGGVFKSTDAGGQWIPMTDGQIGVGTIGAIDVSESNPSVIYVGTGSACPRGNVSLGDGVYKSTDAGKTWQHIGLPKAGLIGKIRIHPQNPDIAYVAVLGNIFGPNKERGVYRTKDGGKTWDQVLSVSDRTGAVDITMDVEESQRPSGRDVDDAAAAVVDRLGQHRGRPLPND